MKQEDLTKSQSGLDLGKPGAEAVDIRSIISEASIRLNKAALLIGYQYADPANRHNAERMLTGLRLRQIARKPRLSSLAWNAASIAFAKKDPLYRRAVK